MVVVVMARFVPAEEAVRVKVALGLLDGHGDDSPTAQTGRPAAVSVWVSLVREQRAVDDRAEPTVVAGERADVGDPQKFAFGQNASNAAGRFDSRVIPSPCRKGEAAGRAATLSPADVVLLMEPRIRAPDNRPIQPGWIDGRVREEHTVVRVQRHQLPASFIGSELAHQ
jgi:hypothetical protein